MRLSRMLSSWRTRVEELLDSGQCEVFSLQKLYIFLKCTLEVEINYRGY